jgi:hypothetical protein
MQQNADRLALLAQGTCALLEISCTDCPQLGITQERPEFALRTLEGTLLAWGQDRGLLLALVHKHGLHLVDGSARIVVVDQGQGKAKAFMEMLCGGEGYWLPLASGIALDPRSMAALVEEIRQEAPDISIVHHADPRGRLPWFCTGIILP